MLVESDRVGPLRGQRRPTKIRFVERDVRLAHELALLPMNVKAMPAPAHRHEEDESADDSDRQLDVNVLGFLEGKLAFVSWERHVQSRRARAAEVA